MTELPAESSQLKRPNIEQSPLKISENFNVHPPERVEKIEKKIVREPLVTFSDDPSSFSRRKLAPKESEQTQSKKVSLEQTSSNRSPKPPIIFKKPLMENNPQRLPKPLGRPPPPINNRPSQPLKATTEIKSIQTRIETRDERRLSSEIQTNFQLNRKKIAEGLAFLSTNKELKNAVQSVSITPNSNQSSLEHSRNEPMKVVSNPTKQTSISIPLTSNGPPPAPPLPPFFTNNSNGLLNNPKRAVRRPSKPAPLPPKPLTKSGPNLTEQLFKELALRKKYFGLFFFYLALLTSFFISI